MTNCLKDSTVGISENDRFTAPPGVSINLGCTGGETEDATETAETQEDYYFD